VKEAILQNDPNPLPFDDLIEMRSITSGIWPAAVLCERNEGIELPHEIHQSEVYHKLILKAGLILRIMNDLLGVGKDIVEKHEINLVLTHNKLTNPGTLQASCKAMIIRHTEALREFDQLVEEVMVTVVTKEWEERVRGYASALRQFAYGFECWLEKAHRYSQYTPYENNHVLVIKTTICNTKVQEQQMCKI
jgi:hypothetical protein